ncbi:MAG: DNA-binding GntR family transcriptional regulator [Janthinobacterium sp.]|jgi:DNA-binding GntR family transcriptional regulator
MNDLIMTKTPTSTETSDTNNVLKKSGSRAEYVYAQLRADIFEMRLLPGDQVTETDIAAYFNVSRTPVREALQRLQRDGLMQGYVRGGWEVVPIDFKRYEDLYELRKVIELYAITRLCADDAVVDKSLIAALSTTWCCPESERLRDGSQVATLDEVFHQTLVRATGNVEMANVFERLTDRVRIVRRLDFVYGDCVQSTYEEHIDILAHLDAREGAAALRLMTEHIEGSHANVNELTLQRLHNVRTQAKAERLRYVLLRVQRQS